MAHSAIIIQSEHWGITAVREGLAVFDPDRHVNVDVRIDVDLSSEALTVRLAAVGRGLLARKITFLPTAGSQRDQQAETFYEIGAAYGEMIAIHDINYFAEQEVMYQPSKAWIDEDGIMKATGGGDYSKRRKGSSRLWRGMSDDEIAIFKSIQRRPAPRLGHVSQIEANLHLTHYRHDPGLLRHIAEGTWYHYDEASFANVTSVSKAAEEFYAGQSDFGLF